MATPRRPSGTLSSEEQVRLLLVAYHEAGHALAAYCTGRRIKAISIQPTTEDDLGSVLAWMRQADEDIQCLLGGVVAVALFCGTEDCCWDGAQGDLADAFKIARHISDGYYREAEAHIAWLLFKTKREMARPEFQVALRSLVGELLKRRQVGPRVAVRIIRNAIAEAQEEQDRNPLCVASTKEGLPCGQPATVHDAHREGMVCQAHAAEDPQP